MRTIIAGSRSITDYNQVERAVALAKTKMGIVPTVILSGHARGVDKLGEQYAKANNIPLELYLPDWDADPRGAGFTRNIKMADRAEALIAISDGQSHGTWHMIRQAKKRNLLVFVMAANETNPNQPSLF